MQERSPGNVRLAPLRISLNRSLPAHGMSGRHAGRIVKESPSTVLNVPK